MMPRNKGRIRRDRKNRILRPGETVRNDGRYQFKYHVSGKPHYAYSWRLEPTDPVPAGRKPGPSLRELEKEISSRFDTLSNFEKSSMTVSELVARYLKAKTGVKYSTRQGYKTVENLLAAEEFGSRKISEIKTSDAKLFLIMLQQEKGKSYSSIHSIRGVLRPAFQMAVDDDVLLKNPFGFELATVIVNDSVTREAITREQMRKFLSFIQDDAIYAKYYDAVYILFHTGLRISEFCGVTVKDIDLERKTLNVERQLIRTSEMDYRCETTKTAAGKRVIPLTDDVAEKFRNILAERRPPRRELVVDGHYGFLYYDKNGLPCVAMHWQHRFNRMVNQYNDLYRVPLPNVTPHVCRHTYCSNMAKSGMSPKTLQYLMGHSDISVTMNTYTHVRFDDAEEELRRLEEFRKAQSEIEKQNDPPLIKAV